MASILWLPIIFALFTFYLYLLSANLPTVRGLDKFEVKFPRNLSELKGLSEVMKLFMAAHHGYVIVLFSSAYIYKQSFAIPGSVFMNLLAGAIFGTLFGFPLACILTSCGATCCYMMSKIFGKAYIMKYFSEKVQKLHTKVEKNSESLLFFLLFLRLFPMSPNWFLNMASPILNIPVHLFFISVFIGLMPYNFICVQTGGILSQIQSMDDIFTTWTMLKLLAVALVALVPGILLRVYQRSNNKDTLLSKDV